MRRRGVPTYRLRQAVNALPRRTREAMLRGIAGNRIIVGAYVDPRSGGICPMLAAHRNGGRTSVASFARAWDAFTGAKRPRRATRREVRALRSLLEQSLTPDAGVEEASIAELAAQIRTERERFARCEAPAAPAPSEPPALDEDGSDLELDLLAIAEAALADAGDWSRTGEPSPARVRSE